ncbi:MAG: hypothetical protein L6455_15280 [Kiritimatiellae bacterium]|nr:hypothetical protein [Kiritimatiellia bacterium]
MKDKDLIFELMRRINPRPLTKRVITLAYKSGYDAKSDGITLGGQFEFQGFKLKNPCGVGHDWLYFMGVKNPCINASGDRQITDYSARAWADNWFKIAMYDFGYWAFAFLYWVALRAFAARAWRMHRARNHPCPVDDLPDVR